MKDPVQSSNLSWTKDTPKEPGYYWIRDVKQTWTEVVELSMRCGFLCYWEEDQEKAWWKPLGFNYHNGEWYGPITPPD